jgi:biopolymer transport protein ExbB/TolQ
VWSWAVIVDKVLRLRAARRSASGWAARAAEARTAEDLVGERYGTEPNHPAGAVLAAGVEECIAFADDAAESMAERRERIDRAMRLALGVQLRQLEHRLPFLATLGSAAPFIGLFGTVWGIMRSFNAIAAANNTSLAVVAPGIADALFATDVMLVLLVIFMVAAPLLTVGVPINLPKTSAAQVTTPQQPLVVSINAAGETFIGDNPASGDALKSQLSELAAQDPTRIVYVRGDRAIQYGTLMDLLGLVNTVGFAKVSLLAEAAGSAPKPQ